MKLRVSSSGYSLLEIVAVMAITVVVSAMAVPMSGNAIRYFRLTGDARSLANAVALAKLRAASDYSQARLYVDVPGGTFHVQTYNKTTSAWVTEGGTTTLSSGVTFGYAALDMPPSDTQAMIGQAPECLDDAGTAVTDTACIVFNSRGIPIACSSMGTVGCSSGVPTVADAAYITDGTAVYGVTVSQTGLHQLWRSDPSTVSWTKQ